MRAGEIVFLSDVVEELDAARDAGLRTVLIDRREDYPRAAHGRGHAWPPTRRTLLRYRADRILMLRRAGHCARLLLLFVCALPSADAATAVRSRCASATSACSTPRSPRSLRSGRATPTCTWSASPATAPRTCSATRSTYLETLMTRRFAAKDRIVSLVNHVDSFTDAAAAGDARQPATGARGHRQGHGSRRGCAAAVPDHARHAAIIACTCSCRPSSRPRSRRASCVPRSMPPASAIAWWWCSACYSGGFIPKLRSPDTPDAGGRAHGPAFVRLRLGIRGDLFRPRMDGGRPQPHHEFHRGVRKRRAAHRRAREGARISSSRSRRSTSAHVSLRACGMAGGLHAGDCRAVSAMPTRRIRKPPQP